MKKWEIWLITLPFINGREQRGIRPCIVLADTGVGMIVIIPVTSSISALRFPYTLVLNKSARNCLEKDSIALIFRIQSIDSKRFIRKMGELDENYRVDITNIINKMLY